MRLYFLAQQMRWRADDDDGGSPWVPWYDKQFGCVVRAPDAQSARIFASELAGDEGPQVWLDDKYTLCSLLDADGAPGVIVRDFKGA